MKQRVEDILRVKGTDVYTIEAHDTVYNAIVEMNRRNVGALLVMSDEGVAGIISERDYTRKVILKNRKSKETRVETIMSTELVVGCSDTTVEEAMMLMTANRIRHLPIMEEERLLGILSIGDLVKSIIAKQKEEIHWLNEYAFGPNLQPADSDDS
jgi:CBS domain-containing protein